MGDVKKKLSERIRDWDFDPIDESDYECQLDQRNDFADEVEKLEKENEAMRLVVDAAKAASSDGVCAECGGDGYYKSRPRLGDEPCPACGGTGKAKGAE